MHVRPRTRSRLRRLLGVAAAGPLLLGVAACGSDDPSVATQPGPTEPAAAGATTLTVYFGQHENLGKALADSFQQATGIKVDVRAGSDSELANQLIEEGSRSPADLFVTEEPGPIAQVDSKNLLAAVDPATLAKTDERFNPRNGNWLAFAARSRAVFYNPSLIREDELPKSLLDLAKPEWKGRFAYAPSGAFTSTVAYMVTVFGEPTTLDWLKGIKANGVNEEKNGKVRDSVEAGQHPFGLSNHYYWHILAEQKGGADKLASRVHYFSNGDPGALVLASGAGVLRSSKHQAEAQRFLSWLADADGGQKIIASDTPQFPLGTGVTSTKGLVPLGQLSPPSFDQGSLADVAKAKDLIIRSGIG